MKRRFDDKVLFATGGGSGIGAACARRFAAEGGRVAVFDLAGDRAQDVAAECENSIGLSGDVSDEASVAAAIQDARTRLGRIDYVLNAAGHVDYDLIEDVSFERWMRLMHVHAGGTFLVCKHALPFLREQKGAAIVTIASIAALVAYPGAAVYSSAKGAILAFSRQLSLDLAPEIRVNVICPGRVHTPLTEVLYEQRWGTYEQGVEISAQHNLQKRLAEPEEIAGVICFLLSDDASFMTGSVVVVDGGETAAI